MAWEASALFALSVVALVARYLVMPSEPVAVGNAEALLDLERALHLDMEAGVQRLAGAVPGILGTLQAYYLVGHTYLVVGTFAAVAWFRPALWRYSRDLFVVMTVAGFVLHLALPIAPPRLTAGAGVTDTLVDGGTHGWRGGPFHGLFNPYAAFPSLHVGSAFLLAFVASQALGAHRWTPLVWVHPTLMSFTVLATGNHWTVDVIGAAAMMVPAAAWLVTRHSTSPEVAGGPEPA